MSELSEMQRRLERVEDTLAALVQAELAGNRSQLAEFRAETTGRFDAVELRLAEQGQLLRAIAAKLGVPPHG